MRKTLKYGFVKILLALSLGYSPVAVFAIDFFDQAVPAKHTPEHLPCHSAMQVSSPDQSMHPDGSDCEMSCCQDSGCIGDCFCLHHYNPSVTQPGLLADRLHPGHGELTFTISSVQTRELPPETPPPIGL